MGNQLDRITHLSYSELPTGDPSGVEKDELRVGVAYFFSDEEEDLDERGQPDKFGVKAPPGCAPCPDSPGRLLRQLVLHDAPLSAFRGQECIFSAPGPTGDADGDGEPAVCAASALPALCEPGDLLELLWLRPEPELEPAPHWAVYVGGGRVIHLLRGEIRQDSLQQAGAAPLGRVVTSWYRFRPLPAALVLQNARGHLGLKREEICWPSSESFAAWCRFGKREFKAGGEALGAQPPQYCLQVHLGGGKVHTARFPRLEDLIREKHRIHAAGRLRGLRELAGLDLDDKE
ncbi:protein LRATD1 [Erinaceus europaeus]|uniref:Protein FAM84A n=1 Tax=Erinaceus europaeus TaxID=9365 RepID=A0A1S2ZJ23_ERIEU|nr:protein LRATD1 [Erinaceus europaeus]XP_060042562.1 protein LRATD1 [Erinaceus europaeus]